MALSQPSAPSTTPLAGRMPKKPIPRNNSHVYVLGYLTLFVKPSESLLEGSEMQTQPFGISIESVDFMGQSTIPTNTVAPSPGMTFLLSGVLGAHYCLTATSLKRGLTFNFDDFGTEKSEVNEDESPTKKLKANGKAKTNHTDAGASSGRGVATCSSNGK